MAKVLLVEDDRDLTSVIREWLEAQNFELDIAYEGNQGCEFLNSGKYDVAILDWDLPGLSGIDILRSHRENSGVTPVLMLTGKGQVVDKETGFDSGADDYLTKPFNIRELGMRVKALARRPATFVSATLKIGDVELDPQKHLVFKAGKEAHLLPKDFELLEFLMRHPGEIFSSDALLAQVWKENKDATSEAVRTSMKRIRQVIDAGLDEDFSMIQTMRRVGYRLRTPEM